MTFFDWSPGSSVEENDDLLARLFNINGCGIGTLFNLVHGDEESDISADVVIGLTVTGAACALSEDCNKGIEPRAELFLVLCWDSSTFFKDSFSSTLFIKTAFTCRKKEKAII